MTTIRPVPLDQDQALLIEQVGLEFLRAGDLERATKLLAIFLAWREPESTRHPASENVVELQGWSRKVGA